MFWVAWEEAGQVIRGLHMLEWAAYFKVYGLLMESDIKTLNSLNPE